MQSDRYYRQSGALNTDGTASSARTSFQNGLLTAEEEKKSEDNTQVSKNDFPLFKTQNAQNTWGSPRSELTDMRDQLLQNLWQLLFNGNHGNGMRSLTNLGSMSGLNAFGGFSAMATTMTYTQVDYSEEEFTSFNAKGLAMTEDGRQLDFNIAVSMSRTFMQYTQVQVPNPFALMDPLMINVGSSVANISDQKFTFDLDADGAMEDISMPGAGTGFLAYDKNEDGIINDGTELFGAISGDGFADLRQYDDDGNGWIDENDEIFHKLKVWYKNGDGEDELVDLLSADVGAICLGSQQTDFSLYSQGGLGDMMNAMIRATGFFFKESGGVGTIQHVDLVASAPVSGDNDLTAEVARGHIWNEVPGVTKNAAGEMSDTTVVKASENGLKVERKKDETDTDADAAAAKERRAQKAAEAKVRHEKRLARRREEQERIDALFEERAENRRRLKEELIEGQYERRLEEEALVELTAAEATEAVDDITGTIQEEVTDESNESTAAVTDAAILTDVTEAIA